MTKKGWNGESQRHSLAKKGIKTSNKNTKKLYSKGACSSFRVVTGKDIKEIEKIWNNMVEENQFESGHSYSGDIGMLGTGFEIMEKGKIFEINEARDYIEENHNKWSNAMAVQIKNPKAPKDTISYLIGGVCSS